MNKRKRILAVAMISILIVVNFTSVQGAMASGNKNVGWRKNAKGWWYLNSDGTYPSNQWQKINNKWYYFNSGGYMKTGWLKAGNKWYYLSNSGAMQTGWQKVGGKWYYFAKSGVMQTGWQKLSGSWYYLRSSGAMATGWVSVNNKWYYMYSSGIMARNTWISGKYYVGSDGAMLTNTITPDGYYVDNNGVYRSTGQWKWEKDSWGYRYTDGKGNYKKNQWQKTNGHWYYFDTYGYAETGLCYIGNNPNYFDNDAYYFDDSGRMRTGWVTIDGDIYYFEPSGKMVRNSWKRIDGYWYYFRKYGNISTGVADIGGHTYYFDNDGKMQTGWATIDGDIYYFEPSGKMAEDTWEKIDGYWYYFYEYGSTARGYNYINGHTYYFDEKGRMQTGWVVIDGRKYYFNSSGGMVENGWERIGGHWYHFNWGGDIDKGVTHIGKDVYYFDNEGRMQTGWKMLDGEYHYFDSTNGKQVTNQWVGEYYLLDTGHMARSRWIDESYVDENGKKDNFIFRITAKNLSVGGLASGSYDYLYYTKGYNFSHPDIIHYYMDTNNNLNVVAYEQERGKDEFVGSKRLIINTYDKDLAFVRQRIINLPYDIFGGFHHGRDGNFYVVCGRKNEECSKTKSVVKVLKYNKDWKPAGSTDIYGSASNWHIGIQIPFDAGNCRMDMRGSTLTIHMARLLFPTSDGLSHQCNITFSIDTNTMGDAKVIQGTHVSHSFNQFIRYDNNNALYVDHGDAYPRSIVATLIKNNGEIKELELFKFQSGVDDHMEYGYNYTGATLSGLGIGEKNNIIIGMARPHNHAINGITGYDKDLANNIYQVIFDKDCNKATFKWITKYDPKKTTKKVNEPRLVRVSGNRFAVIFSEEDKGVDTLQYRLIDDNGNILASHSYRGIHFPGSSDPIVMDGKIIWVATDKGIFSPQNNYFYSIPVLYE